ncbi:carbonic anhydrase, alpha-class, catalytic domain-containingprotein [Purpureocillium lavendulum]|uniref:carbonic anhydrase n=1 Tax=Purpureocillium lavendulum TaxID=1247861 RepID=A0AB34G1V3_9HYPO|nr:carbonic anhydrase, alpha-class, catalytic domain-containingprotein [Purpureocillium lavendulum]
MTLLLDSPTLSMIFKAAAGLMLLAFINQVQASCAYGTILQPRAENGAVKGPANWVNLDPTKNSLCTHGTKQSPIDMVPGSLSLVPGRNLSISIPDRTEGVDFENLGTTVEVVAKGGNMTFGGVQYTLQQFHFHLPSEHLDNGTSMAMEMHMVWQGPAGQIAVIGTFIDVNDAAGSASASNSALLDGVLGSVEQITRPGSKTKTGPLKMSDLVNVLSAGSFQTEGVRWLVSTQKLSIQPSTFKKARSVIGFNARFLQNNVATQKPKAPCLSLGIAG